LQQIALSSVKMCSYQCYQNM